jgi:hypothetical protein
LPIGSGPKRLFATITSVARTLPRGRIAQPVDQALGSPLPSKGTGVMRLVADLFRLGKRLLNEQGDVIREWFLAHAFNERDSQRLVEVGPHSGRGHRGEFAGYDDDNSCGWEYRPEEPGALGQIAAGPIGTMRLELGALAAVGAAKDVKSKSPNSLGKGYR